MRRTGAGEQPATPDAAPALSGDPESVDADVPGAVGRVLEEALRERLAESEATDHAFAHDIARRLARFTLRGGKRTRSQFLWWGMRACGEASEVRVGAALQLAAGLELVQTCALVHDDVMDDSATRRGKPSVHAEIAEQYAAVPAGGPRESFARSAAILLGDLALAWADDLAEDIELPAPTRYRVRRVWRVMRTEMVAGQYLDVLGQAASSWSAPWSAARAIRIARLKSALYSVERPLDLGAVLAGADARTTRSLRSAGRCAGLAFQLRDDLLGVFGDPRDTGKPAGEDIRRGKLTYLIAVAHARAEADGDRASVAVLESARGDALLTDAGLDRVRSVLVSTGARTMVETKIVRLMSHSARHLAAAAVEPTAGRRLYGLLHAVAGVPTPCGEGGTGGTGTAAGPGGEEPPDGPPVTPAPATHAEGGTP
ncbi:polyprenyl synthetase family protein [Streptomyces sp. NPDC002018]|uniref:polyprenyl synthetase family protein n=1 Tax=Streptomyces sp. NPDC002018 TaxID=3364629 RepID=UPI0036C41BFA